MNGRSRLRKAVVPIVGFVALAAVPVLALNSLATATVIPNRGSQPVRSSRQTLTNTPRPCLADHGVTLPTRPVAGPRPELTPVQRDTLGQPAEACGRSVGPRFVAWYI